MSEDNGEPTPPEQPGSPEQQASAAPGQPPPPPPQFNPQSAYPAGPYPDPYAAPRPFAPQPYPQAPGHPGFPAYPAYVLPDYPKATSALIIGLVAVAGTFVCGLPVLASPVAWVLGAQARAEIRRSPQQWAGEGKATAGMVLGIIGTVLLLLAIIVIAVIIVVAVNDPNAFDPDTSV